MTFVGYHVNVSQEFEILCCINTIHCMGYIEKCYQIFYYCKNFPEERGHTKYVYNRMFIPLASKHDAYYYSLLFY